MSKKSRVIGYLWQLSWLSPHTEPPNGQPRVLAACYLRADLQGSTRHRPESIMRLWTAGSGYFVGLDAVLPAIKPWSPARKFRYRRSRLAARVRKKYPMFAEAIIAERIAARPEYFGTEQEASG